MQRPATPGIFQANLLLGGALLIGLLLALFLGATVGESDYLPLVIICFTSMGLLFAVSLYRYIWQIALFLLYFAFAYRPTSFNFGPIELGCALGVAVIGIFFWQRKSFTRPKILSTPAFAFLSKVLFVWLAYVAIHLVFNVKVPYLPGEFKLTNALKSYFALSAPLFLFFYFSRSPVGLIVKKDFFWRVTQIATAGLLINLLIRAYELVGGYGVFIPIINATSNGYALRGLGPMAMLLGAVGITGPRSQRRTATRAFTFWLLVVLGSVGALFSGGRATVVYGFLCVCAVLFFRRKVMALGLVLMLGILGIAAANFAARWINTEANPFVQRSVQWILFEKNWETVSTLESSTSWRKQLFSRSVAEWQADARVFWTGRATFGFGTADETAVVVAGGYEAAIQTALRRGATHNLITDLLIAYGIIGLVLYFVVYFALVRWFWQLHHARRDLSSAASNLVLTCLVGSIFALLLDVTSGGYFPTDILWFGLVLVAAFHNRVGLSETPAIAGHDANGSLQSSAEPAALLPSRRRQTRPRGSRATPGGLKSVNDIS